MADLPSTVLYPNAFRHAQTAGNDGIYHWDFWEPAIARRNISPTDADAMVGIRLDKTLRSAGGVFLIAETKDEGVEIKKGQQMLLDDLIATGLFTVIYQTGKESPVSWACETFQHPRSEELIGGLDQDRRDGSLFRFIRRWATWADSLDPHEWRRRMIMAALKNAPIEIWIWLKAYLKEQHVKALRDLDGTPLGQSSTQKLMVDLE